MKTFATLHIKLEDHEIAELTHHAMNNDLRTAQLIRKILRGWLAGQVIVSVDADGPVRAQTVGHRGYDVRG